MFQYYPNMQRYTQQRTARTKRMTKKTHRSVTSSCVKKVLRKKKNIFSTKKMARYVFQIYCFLLKNLSSSPSFLFAELRASRGAKSIHLLFFFLLPLLPQFQESSSSARSIYPPPFSSGKQVSRVLLCGEHLPLLLLRVVLLTGAALLDVVLLIKGKKVHFPQKIIKYLNFLTCPLLASARAGSSGRRARSAQITCILKLCIVHGFPRKCPAFFPNFLLLSALLSPPPPPSPAVSAAGGGAAWHFDFFPSSSSSFSFSDLPAKKEENGV